MGRRKKRRQPTKGRGLTAGKFWLSRSSRSGSPATEMGDRKRAGTGDPPLKNRRPVLRFLALFCPFIGLFYLCWWTPFFNAGFSEYLRLNADAASSILSLFGEDTSSSGKFILSSQFSLEIKRGCDAVEPSALFIAAVLAFPATLGRKTTGMLVGTGFLMVVNLVRIVSLFYVGVYFPKAFRAFHLDVWQAVFILLALLVWIVWAQWAIRRPALPANAPK